MEPLQIPRVSFYKARPLTKVDEATRTVHGIITDETPDRTGEICDYDTSKPYYQAWSDEIAKASQGKSLGNIRLMHGLVAIGVLKSLEFDDVNKRISGATKVINDDAWKDVANGVLSFYSHGGGYIKTWKDGDFSRYTASISEVSLVDIGCNPSASFDFVSPDATFEFVKVDGTTELRKFKRAATFSPTLGIENNSSDPTRNLDFSTTVDADPKKKGEKGKEDMTQEEAETLIRSIVAEELVKATTKKEKVKPSPKEVEKAVKVIAQKAYQKAFPEVAKTTLIGAMTKADLSFDRRSELINGALKQEFGLDGSGWQKAWAIETYETYVIIADSDGKLYSIPYTIEGDEAKLGEAKTEVEVNYTPVEGVKKLATALPRTVRMVKGMNTVARLADLLLDLAWLKWSVTEEQGAEGDDDSVLPKLLEENLSSTADTLVAMVNEEVSELKDMSASGQSPYECGNCFYCAAPTGSLTKANPVGLNQWTSSDHKGEIQVGTTEHGMHIGFGDHLKADISTEDKDAIAKMEPGASHEFKDGENKWNASRSSDGDMVCLSCSVDGTKTEGNVGHSEFLGKAITPTIIKTNAGETFIKVAGELILSAC